MKLINQYDPTNRDLLENLQGNILKSHGREHTVNLFIDGKEGKQDDVKKWLSSLAISGQIQSCYDQLRDIQNWKAKGIDAGAFACVHISYRGYEYLLGQQEADKLTGTHVAFKGGMGKAQLNDQLEKLDEGLESESHFLLILANNDVKALKQQVKIIKLQLNNIAIIN